MAKRTTGKRPTGGTDYIKWVLLGGAVVAVLAVAYLAADRYNLFHRTLAIDPSRYPVRGIDVSKHNGDIDFAAVAGEGYSFVYIKASEGATYRDARFKRNIDAARRAGLKVGAYHFFRKNREGAVQATNFLNAVAGQTLDLPLVVDVEDWDNDHFVGNETVQQRLRDMLAALRGRHVMIYTNGDGYRKYYVDRLNDYDLWLCSFSAPDSLATFRHTFQQYSHWGTVQGIEGDVDLNIFVGNKRDWERSLKNWKQ